MQLDIPGALRRMREESEMTQAEIADLLGIPQRSYSDWERGAIRLTVDQMLAAEDVCAMPPGQVLRLAGAIRQPVDTVTVISLDVKLTSRWKDMVIAAYASAVRQSKDERAAAATRSEKKARTRRS